ncbi:MAG: AAA family ATPase, partial [Nanoarchaeota archaeon]|nr:AAA family ATPase [Nanoarchaeota archaeon]
DIRLAFELYRDEFANNTQRQYIFFDEVQYIDDYQEYIKLIYDKRKTEIKFFLTGLLSLDYKKRVQDSLAGRYFEYRMFPLFFEEYLYLSGHPLYQQFLSVKNDPDLAKVTGLTEKLSSLFRDFLYFYRLPETIGYDQEQATLYIQTVKAQSLNKDVLDYFEVRKPQLINLLYEEIVRRSGDEISLRSLSQKGFKTTHQTLSKYLEILEIMSLVYVVYNTDKLVKQTKALKKVYTSSHFCSEDRDVGYLVESYVLERLLSESNTVTFYRQRNKEVDFLLPKKKQAIEVKYRSKLEPEDLISLGEFSKKRGFQSKIVTLKDYGHDVLGLGADLVPAMLF